MIFNPSREDARRFYFETWRKFQHNLPLSGAESTALAIIQEHPEYHGLLNCSDIMTTQEYPPQLGNTNPFLHLSMHLAIREQLALNQPVGIKDYYLALLARHVTPADAQHEMMDCLAEMIWQAQRQQTEFSPVIYFACLDKKLVKVLCPRRKTKSAELLIQVKAKLLVPDVGVSINPEYG